MHIGENHHQIFFHSSLESIQEENDLFETVPDADPKTDSSQEEQSIIALSEKVNHVSSKRLERARDFYSQPEEDLSGHVPTEAQSSKKKQRMQRSKSIDPSYFESIKDASSQEKPVPTTDLSSAPLSQVLEGSARTRGGVQRSTTNSFLIYRRSLASLEKTVSSSDAPSVIEEQVPATSRPRSISRMQRIDHGTIRALLSNQPSTSTDVSNALL